MLDLPGARIGSREPGRLPLPDGQWHFLKDSASFLKDSRLSVAGGPCCFGICRVQAAALLLRFHLLTGFIDLLGRLIPLTPV